MMKYKRSNAIFSVVVLYLGCSLKLGFQKVSGNQKLLDSRIEM